MSEEINKEFSILKEKLFDLEVKIGNLAIEQAGMVKAEYTEGITNAEVALAEIFEMIAGGE